jgi:hypothetical protein
MVRALRRPTGRPLGRSQVVRQRILIPPFPGSIPGAPASQSGLSGLCPVCKKNARYSRELARRIAVSEAQFSGFSAAPGQILRAGLRSPIFNIRLVSSETRFEPARDRFDVRVCSTHVTAFDRLAAADDFKADTSCEHLPRRPLERAGLVTVHVPTTAAGIEHPSSQEIEEADSNPHLSRSIHCRRSHVNIENRSRYGAGLIGHRTCPARCRAVSETKTAGLFGQLRPFSRASLRSPIFNIRLVAPETRFEYADVLNCAVFRPN